MSRLCAFKAISTWLSVLIDALLPANGGGVGAGCDSARRYCDAVGHDGWCRAGTPPLPGADANRKQQDTSSYRRRNRAGHAAKKTAKNIFASCTHLTRSRHGQFGEDIEIVPQGRKVFDCLPVCGAAVHPFAKRRQIFLRGLAAVQLRDPGAGLGLDGLAVRQWRYVIHVRIVLCLWRVSSPADSHAPP
jgi:hypothetical protein